MHLVPRLVGSGHEGSWLAGIRYIAPEPCVPVTERVPGAGRAKLWREPLAEAGERPGSSWTGTAVYLVPRVGVVNGVVVMGVGISSGG